jgi:mannose-6-phosphate isomerase-like protein (cupin superfamily)
MDINAIRNDPNYKRIEPSYVEFAEVDDIWVRAYTVEKAKSVISQHVHLHDHITLISSGAVEAWQDGEILGEFRAPAVITIPAGKKHAFTALTDNVVLCCLHNLRGTGLEAPEIMDKELHNANR